MIYIVQFHMLSLAKYFVLYKIKFHNFKIQVLQWNFRSDQESNHLCELRLYYYQNFDILYQINQHSILGNIRLYDKMKLGEQVKTDLYLLFNDY